MVQVGGRLARADLIPCDPRQRVCSQLGGVQAGRPLGRHGLRSRVPGLPTSPHGHSRGGGGSLDG
eukprot:4512928-Lingulodinium_polyedra.AAC.1